MFYDAQDLPLHIFLIAVFLLIAFPVHEFSHAAAAYLQGDATAKLFGRLTLNPIVHFDPMGGMMTVVSALLTPFIFGWAKPTPVNTANLRDRRNGEVIVALAGPASNLIMAALAAIAYRALGLDFRTHEALDQAVYLFVLFNVALTVFNLIPIPPLDGSVLLFRVLSPRQAWELRPMLAQYGIFILLIFIFLASRLLSDVMFGVTDFLVGI